MELMKLSRLTVIHIPSQQEVFVVRSGTAEQVGNRWVLHHATGEHLRSYDAGEFTVRSASVDE